LCRASETQVGRGSRSGTLVRSNSRTGACFRTVRVRCHQALRIGGVVSSSRGYPGVRAGDDERFRPQRNVHRPAWVGVQTGASACRRRAGRRNRRETAVAAHWRMGPAVRVPTNQFSTCRENPVDSSHTPGSGNSRAIDHHGRHERAPNDAVRCTRGVASKQTPCVCTRNSAS
jgi:hypothetical protein